MYLVNTQNGVEENSNSGLSCVSFVRISGQVINASVHASVALYKGFSSGDVIKYHE